MSGDRNRVVADCKPRSITHATVIGVVLTGVVVLCSLPGCGTSKKSNYYMLDHIVPVSTVRPVSERLEVQLGIGPVTLPEYLNRTQIVQRTGRHGIDIAEYHRWAEPMESSISRVLAENLSDLLITENITPYPRGATFPEYRVEIDIIQFDSDSIGNVQLTARWALLQGRNDNQISWKKFSIKRPIAGQGYPGMVSAMSLILYDFSREIARYVTTEAIHGGTRLD
jgi:uncharacterized lipoprotein YmbA